jgi:calcineurin-like phosphoesterase family protein
MIYATADWHLRHKKINEYCGRPWDNVEDHDTAVLHNYIDTVGPSDTCFFLGDLTIKRNSADKPWLAELFSQLPGEKHLIIGNHDYFTKKFYIEECGFKSVQRKIVTKGMTMVHNPKDFGMECWLNNGYHLHGHVHSHYPAMKFTAIPALNSEFVYDVGLDANNYKPVALKAIKKFFDGPYTRLEKEFAFSQKRNI